MMLNNIADERLTLSLRLSVEKLWICYCQYVFPYTSVFLVLNFNSKSLAYFFPSYLLLDDSAHVEEPPLHSVTVTKLIVEGGVKFTSFTHILYICIYHFCTFNKSVC